MTDRPSMDPRDIWQDGSPGPPGKGRPGRSRRTRARRSRPAGRQWLAIAGYAALAFSSLCLAAIAFLLVAAPVDIVRDRAIEQVKARTGRDLVVAGPTSLSLFPRLAVSLKDVSLSAPEGMEAPPTLAVPTLEVELSLWSLLTRQAAVQRITLHRPTIELSVDAQRRRSWEGAVPPRPALRPALPGGDAAQPTAAPSPEGANASTALSKLEAGSIRIIDATVHYRDHGAGSHSEFRGLDLTLAAHGPARPVEITGMLTVRGSQLALSGTVAPLHALMSKQPAHVSFKVVGSPIEANYEGTLALADGVALEGVVSVKAASAAALGGWFGRSLAPTDADTVAALAQLKVAHGQVTFSALEASVGGASVTGSLALTAEHGRHRLSGSLQLSELDFGLLLRRPDRAAAAPGLPQAAAPSAPAASAPPAAARPGGPPSSSAPLSPQPAKAVDGKGWSDDPLNLKVLNALDADLAIAAQRLTYKDIKTGKSQLSVALKGGVAIVTLEDIELYSGRGRGLLTLDGSGPTLTTSANLQLDGVAVRPLLTDALRVSWLEGRGSIAVALTGKGLSERQIVENLNGKVDLAGNEGALVGIDVGKVVRSLQRARLPDLTPSPDEKTPFKELSGTFIVTNGVARNQDLKLVGTHLQLAGEGTLDLGPRLIDYTIRPKISVGQTEPGATLKVGSLEIPVSIVGPWEKPAFGIRGQEQLSGALKQIGKNFKSQDVQDALKGLLQGDGDRRERARELMDKLLKKN